MEDVPVTKPLIQPMSNRVKEELTKRRAKEMSDCWWLVHDNMVVLTSWLADHGANGHDLAYVVEKPWKFETEFNMALHELDQEG